MPRFTDSEIEKLFGADDAENEDMDRFLSYFYVNRAYESLISELPIRILIGHKGVGKSALLKRSFYEDQSSKRTAIWMQPGEISALKEQLHKISSPSTHIERWKIYLLQYVWRNLVEKIYGHDAITNIPETAQASVKSLQVLINKLFSEKNIITVNVYIDDIDRAWSASIEDIRDISALINAVRDIASPAFSPKISFRIGLRSDVYFLVRTSDESTDKIEGNIIWLKWDNNEILRLMAKRIRTYFGEDFEAASNLSQQQINDLILSKVIEAKFYGGGRWENERMHTVLLSLTRARPRDLVKLLRGAAKKAYQADNEIIKTANLTETFSSYSQERLQDIINEYRSELPKIEQLLFGMRPTVKERRESNPFQYSTDSLIRRISNLMDQNRFAFANGRPVSARALIQFMYKIDFITARKQMEHGKIQRKYFDESRFLASEIVDFGYDWEIHPAYRWALQPQGVGEILDQLKDEA